MWSIAWASCLSAVEDDSVSRLTANVLRRFRDPAPFEVPGSERADE